MSGQVLQELTFQERGEIAQTVSWGRGRAGGGGEDLKQGLPSRGEGQEGFLEEETFPKGNQAPAHGATHLALGHWVPLGTQISCPKEILWLPVASLLGSSLVAQWLGPGVHTSLLRGVALLQLKWPW